MRILLVEDNEALAENLAEVFRDAGHEVLHVADGAGALREARSGFDVAILDVRLPDTLGTAVLPRLKELAPDAEAIVTTGNADLGTAIEAVRGGAFAYLTKPVAIPELNLTVKRALERVQLRRRARELQEALEASERRYRGIVETVQAMILALDRDLRIRFLNRAVEEVAGWKREELLGREHFEVFAPPQEREWRRALARAAFTGKSKEHEVDFVCKDGSKRRVQIRWSRWPLDGEELIYGMGLDVTRQRELERTARVSEKLAAVGTLAAGLAHEIRNPLNAAGLQLALLSRRVSRLADGERSALDGPLGLVREELQRLEGLLADFLAFARPREYQRFPVDLASVLRGVIDLEREAALANRRTLVTDIGGPVFVLGDQDGLRQVFVNLVKNALEASRTTVRIRLTTERSRAVVTVEDDGGGIPSDVAARVFEPFFTTKPQGTGLGLTIVHTIVTAHGGEVSLAPREIAGTLARVVLPLGPEGAPT